VEEWLRLAFGSACHSLGSPLTVICSSLPHELFKISILCFHTRILALANADLLDLTLGRKQLILHASSREELALRLTRGAHTLLSRFGCVLLNPSALLDERNIPSDAH